MIYSDWEKLSNVLNFVNFPRVALNFIWAEWKKDMSGETISHAKFISPAHNPV